MIEQLSDMPDGVVGIRVSGRLAGDELRAVAPRIQEVIKAGDVRMVEVIDHDYEGFGPGGLAEDLKLGFGAVFPHHAQFKRIAVVTDKDWIVHTLHAFAWMVPGEFAIFGPDEFEHAKQWAAG